MAYSIIRDGGAIRPRIRSLTGTITTDAAAQPSTTMTATAGQFNNITVGNNAVFNHNDVVLVPGGGTAAADMAVSLSVFGPSNGTASTTAVCVRQYRPVISAVAGVTITAYYKVWTRFRPRKIRLFNRNTLYTYLWQQEMAEDTAYQITNAGAQTLLTTGGIWPMMEGFVFAPALLGINSVMDFEAAFSTP
jgi:hypothetical protein